MAGETCEYVGADQLKCGSGASPCSRCHKAFCPRCFGVHFQEAHPPIPELNIEPDEPLTEAQAPAESTKTSAFDPLFVEKAPEGALSKPVEPSQEPEEPEKPITEEEVGEMFSSEIDKIVQALNRLSLRGLNQTAVIALIHDAEPKISKSTIATVLKTLRQLPDLYGRKRPGRKT